MQDFEIRIITPNFRASHVFVTSLPSDFAAIRRAHALVGPEQGIEVWRDGACIYASHRGQTLSVLPQAAEAVPAGYEIRLLRADSTTSLIWKCLHQTDASAIRAGIRAADGQAVEIWRDNDCIFRGGRRASPAA